MLDLEVLDIVVNDARDRKRKALSILASLDDLLLKSYRAICFSDVSHSLPSSDELKIDSLAIPSKDKVWVIVTGVSIDKLLLEAITCARKTLGKSTKKRTPVGIERSLCLIVVVHVSVPVMEQVGQITTICVGIRVEQVVFHLLRLAEAQLIVDPVERS